MAAGRSESIVHEITLPIFWAQGGKLVDEKGGPIFHLGRNREYLADIFQLYHDLIYRYKVTPKSNIEIPGFWKGLDAEIYAGKYAMVMHGSWFISNLRHYTPESWQNWGVYYIPTPESDQYGSASGGWTWAIYTSNKEKQRAIWKFIEFMNTPENQAKAHAARGPVPTRDSAWPMYIEQMGPEMRPYVKFFRKVPPITGVRPGVPLYVTVSEQLQIAIGNVLTDRMSIGEAIDKGAKECMAEWERLQR